MNIDKLKKMHSAMSIEKKDINLQDLVGSAGAVTVKVKGFASKYIQKYHNENNMGMHTMVYLADGRKTGAFSNALYEFASFFYKGAGLDTMAPFNKIDFADDSFIEVKIEKVKLDGNKSTYNFEILDGIINRIERMGAIEGQAPLLLEATQGLDLPQIEEPKAEAEAVPVEETKESKPKK